MEHDYMESFDNDKPYYSITDYNTMKEELENKIEELENKIEELSDKSGVDIVIYQYEV